MFFADLFISGYMLVALNAPSVLPLRKVHIEPPQISAKSAAVYDVKRGKFLFEKDPEAVLPIASLTKLASGLVILDAMNLDSVVTLTEEAIATPGDAGDFQVGERVSARHLLFASLIQSSNDAIMALAGEVGLNNFLALMKAKARHLGIPDVTFNDPVGLSEKTRGSVSAVINLARAAFTNELVAKILSVPEYTFTSESGRAHKLTTTNDLIFDPRVIAAKTGFLYESGENYAALVRLEEKDTDLIVVLLGSQSRKSDMLLLLNWLETGFVWK